MIRDVLVVCGVISVPFICVYLFYMFMLIGIPDYKQTVPQPLRLRLEAVVKPKDFHFVFLLPCLNEERVIQNTLQAILSLPYKNLTCVVIDDASDDNTAVVVRAMNNPRIRLLQRKLPNARKGKGEALNICYQRLNRAVRKLGIHADNVIVVVIDGDGRPSSNLLTEAVETFTNPHVGAAQARIRITNRDKWLPFMQDLEFAATVGAMQNAREYLGSVGLGGNGQFTRLTTLQSLGSSPWNACLLEDFDIGLRILLTGWKIRFLSESYVAQQGLHSIRRFIRQRARWVQGNMQCLRYIQQILRSSLPKSAKLDLLYFLAQPWLNMLGTLIQISAYTALLRFLFSPQVKLQLPVHQMDWLMRILAWLVLTLLPGGIWATLYRKRFLERTSLNIFIATLFFPIYNLLVLPSVWIAFLRHIRRKNAWVKTERIVEHPSHS